MAEHAADHDGDQTSKQASKQSRPVPHSADDNGENESHPASSRGTSATASGPVGPAEHALPSRGGMSPHRRTTCTHLLRRLLAANKHQHDHAATYGSNAMQLVRCCALRSADRLVCDPIQIMRQAPSMQQHSMQQ
jgi:hypothetical protein